METKECHMKHLKISISDIPNTGCCADIEIKRGNWS